MGTTRSLIYETADARNVGREMPSLEMLMHISLFSGLVLSPSTAHQRHPRSQVHAG